MRSLLLTTLLLGFAWPAAADDTAMPRSVMFPGSVNFTMGTLSPAEPGNVISSLTADQGFAVWRRGPLFAGGYVTSIVRNDSDGLAWNHGLGYGAGMRVTMVSGAQVLQASVGVGAEQRPRGAQPIHAALNASVSYWRGWSGDHQKARITPGSAWVSSGVISAREPGNWITSGAAEQGLQVARFQGVGVVPVAAASASMDTDGHDWNNRAIGDVGVKFVHSVPGGVVDVRVLSRHEYRWQSDTMRQSPAVTVNLWMGWTPRLAIR